MTSDKLKELSKTQGVGLVRGACPGCTPPPQVPGPTWGTLVPQLQTSSLSSTDAATQGAPGRHRARASCQPRSSSSKP